MPASLSYFVVAIVCSFLYAEAAVFRVSDFGARPNTGADQLSNVTAALSAAAALHNSTLLFDLVGEYHLSGFAAPPIIQFSELLFWALKTNLARLPFEDGWSCQTG